MLVSDIEANGLLDTVTQFHCASTKDFHTGEKKRYYPWDFNQYVDDLLEYQKTGYLVFHNGIKYDYPAIEKLAKLLLNRDIKFNKKKCLDSIVISRLVFANIGDLDMPMIRRGLLAGRYYGLHSLESWGARTGTMKDDYAGDPDTVYSDDPKEDKKLRYENRWVAYNETMGSYCEQDVEATCAALEKMVGVEYYWPNGAHEPLAHLSMRIEHEAAWVLAEMERNGFPFDSEGAERLYTTLAAERQDSLVTLVNTFGSWYKPRTVAGRVPFPHPKTGKPLSKYAPVIFPKTGDIFLKDGKTLAKTDKVKDAPYTPVEQVTFSPTSRQHIIKVLEDAGWKPTEFTDNGQAIVDDDILENVKMEDPHKQHCVELIRRYLMIQKRIGQVAEGKNAWMTKVGADGKMHGSVNPNGAVTGRATHSNPNMGQVPSIDKEFGKECRALFGASHVPNFTQVGVDASGLELRCLGHFMARYDEGEYIDVILNGDIHTVNQQAAGLPTRNNAKTFIYGWLYGAGAAKIGEIVGGSAAEGKALIKSFLEKIPAIAALREAINTTLISSSKWVGGQQEIKWKRKWIRGLDGRKVHVRSAHSALNSLLQSAGAIICKAWVIETHRLLTEKYEWQNGWDADFCYMAWVHDELQIAVSNKHDPQFVIDVSQEAMTNVEKLFEFKCPLATDGKSGASWKECH